MPGRPGSFVGGWRTVHIPGRISQGAVEGASRRVVDGMPTPRLAPVIKRVTYGTGRARRGRDR